MPLTLQQKQSVVSEVAEVAARAHSVIAAEYQGLTVGEMTALRVQARESNVQMRVVKNTLARRAFEGTDYDCMKDSLQGQMVYAFSMEEPGGAARVLKDYTKANMTEADDSTAVAALAGTDVVRFKVGRGNAAPVLDLDSVAATANGSVVTIDGTKTGYTVRFAQADLDGLEPGSYDCEVSVVDDSESAPVDAIRVIERGVLHLIDTQGGDIAKA